MSVHLLNNKHEPLVVWDFDRAWPVKWVVSDLKAQDSGIVVETIEIAYRSFKKTINT
jgi:phage tail-like protein